MRAKPQIRIIAGSLKGRRLASPDWPGLRPDLGSLAGDAVQRAGRHASSARVCSTAFAGTGAVGIEAISRGAAHVTFVERDPRALDLIGENLTRCGVTGGYTILRADVTAAGPAGLPAAFELVVPRSAIRDGARRGGRDRRAPWSRRRAAGNRARAAQRPGGIASPGSCWTRTLTAGDSALVVLPARAPAAANRHEHEPAEANASRCAPGRSTRSPTATWIWSRARRGSSIAWSSRFW